MGRLEYLTLLGLCLVATLPLEWVLGARVWRQPRRALRAILPVLAIFAAWDAIAVAMGHWRFNPAHVTGVVVLGLPVDELAFFVVVPLCGLLTFEAVRRILNRGAR